MSERTVWWQAPDAASMADLLEAARSASALDATPRPAPAGASPETLHRAAVLVAQRRLAESQSSADRVVMEEIKAIDDLVRAANLLVERLREWYALHAPGITRHLTDAEELTRAVAEHGDRAHVVAALDLVESGVGTELEPADVAVLQGFASALRGVHVSWRAIEARIEETMPVIAGNLTAVIGPVLGARFIALAGGLPRLGTMSAGTIQTLGAETALFRHIKDGDRPPKHGILYQHPLVFQAPPWQRGAISRVLANHAAIAARADAYTGNDRASELRASLDADLASIRAKKAKAPERAPVRGPKGGRGPKGPSGPRGKGPAGGPGAPRRSQGPAPGGKPSGKPAGKSHGKPHGKPAGAPYRKPSGDAGGPSGPPSTGRRVPSNDGPARPPSKGGRR